VEIDGHMAGWRDSHMYGTEIGTTGSRNRAKTAQIAMPEPKTIFAARLIRP